MRKLVVGSMGGHAWIPDDEPETDTDRLVDKYFDLIEWDIEFYEIEEY